MKKIVWLVAFVLLGVTAFLTGLTLLEILYGEHVDGFMRYICIILFITFLSLLTYLIKSWNRIWQGEKTPTLNTP